MKILVSIGFALLLTACTASPAVKCDGRLQPINGPSENASAPKDSSSPPLPSAGPL